MPGPSAKEHSQKVVISEARLSSTVALAAVPVLLIIGSIIAGLFGRGLEDGVYYRVFGPAVYLIFFGGSAYAFYEFTKTLMGRARYLTYSDGCIHILAHSPINLTQIRSVSIEHKLFLKNLVIEISDGKTVRIRGYLLQRDMNEVKKTIEMIQGSRSP